MLEPLLFYYRPIGIRRPIFTCWTGFSTNAETGVHKSTLKEKSYLKEISIFYSIMLTIYFLLPSHLSFFCSKSFPSQVKKMALYAVSAAVREANSLISQLKSASMVLIVSLQFLIGLQVECFHQQAPFNVPHCIARFMKEWNVGPKRTVQDQITPSQHLEHEKAYDIIPFLDEDIVNDSYPRKISDYVEHNDAILLVKIDTYWSPSKQAWQIGFSGNPCTPDS